MGDICIISQKIKKSKNSINKNPPLLAAGCEIYILIYILIYIPAKQILGLNPSVPACAGRSPFKKGRI
ncbi:hypothetical protein A2Y83_04215 [Candidatus Falkowbacteria bacterium RBG_13_39_14]|uniref:Uncharacterized protein n=1 Tax=Candidatus Falkowbacteria bacterium RBG_13_39_14 TaxID=1797985 RepID=A0A1F5S2E6_9BACT|nr:MAG: hypothetical protein A2Y83_04215 [Candidatus Falkowbacteria bacterium RBG_13_39_14]